MIKRTSQIQENAHLLKYIVGVNLSAVILIIVLVVIYADDSNTFLRAGPQTNLIIISVKIDTWARYGILQLILFYVTISRAFVGEIGNSVLRFYVYDMNTTRITDITIWSLGVQANVIYYLSGIRDIILTVVSIQQIDIALCALSYYTFVQIISIAWLLHAKKFDKTSDHVCHSVCSFICVCLCSRTKEKEIAFDEI